MRIKRGLIWGTGKVFQNYISTIKYHEIVGNFKIEQVTSNEPNVYISDYEYIKKEDINFKDYDIVLIMANGTAFNSITQEAIKLGFKNHQLIPAYVIKHALFDIDKYLDILKSKPSIFANMCWGGYTYSSMCLKFTSPFINMYLSDKDYIKFLKSPKFYLKQNIEFLHLKCDNVTKFNFPVASCGDILLNFNHTNNFSVAKNDWDKRKNRVNWDNIICMMKTDNPEIEEEFNALPYKKKICFVPYKTRKKYSLCVDLRIKNKDFAWVINRLGDGTFIYYDPFEILNTGIAKKNLLDIL